MTTGIRPQGATVLDALVENLRARSVVLDGQERPVAILWTDPREEWRPLIDLAQDRIPEVFVLGDYRPGARTGPAIWIRCVVDRSIVEPTLSEGGVPVVYLPGVARQQLRAGEECPDAWKPLVELMYRGTLWLQPNGSDWAVTAFLTSPKTLGLDIARDRATTDALARALREVALTPVAQLVGRHLQADDFDRMLAADVARDLLRWMGDPRGTRVRLGASGWGAFRSRCREELDFDPEVEADVVAGERLGCGDGAWSGVWERFVESPTSYGDIAGLLRRSRPAGVLAFGGERWPDSNDDAERALRAELVRIRALSHPDACAAVTRLENDHGPRRGQVWARMGLAPMAQVLEHLALLAASAGITLGGTTPEDVAAAYLERGWQADAAAWEALAAAATGDESLIGEVVRHLLAPWLEDSARTFQAAVERKPLPGPGGQPLVGAAEDVCILFADGLRFDLARRLSERLEVRGCRVCIGHRWAALPTVTATAKPAVTPVADGIAGDALGEDFAPIVRSTGKSATAANLRSALVERGYQLLGSGAFDSPMSHPARGWIEAGEIDSLGHKLGVRLAGQLEEELERLAGRITGLLDAGWKAVRVVTDHGWLLLPGGLPKVDLPRHLTASRWSRCATIAEGATPAVLRAPWHWNPRQWFATGPGIACFSAGEVYAHGGLSVQECLTPDLLVERTGEAGVAATIQSITWRGLRCFVEASARGGSVVADLRLERPSGRSIVAASKLLEPDGSASLVLAGDEHEGAALVLVLLDDSGRILSQRSTRVGADS